MKNYDTKSYDEYCDFQHVDSGDMHVYTKPTNTLNQASTLLQNA